MRMLSDKSRTKVKKYKLFKIFQVKKMLRNKPYKSN